MGRLLGVQHLCCSVGRSLFIGDGRAVIFCCCVWPIMLYFAAAALLCVTCFQCHSACLPGFHGCRCQL